MQYLTAAGTETTGCFLCAAAADDEGEGVVYRTTSSIALLNAFPYNTGHVMVAPRRHLGDLTDLTEEERADAMEATNSVIVALRDAFGPDGFNVGVNIGAAAGAGVPGHLHLHVVPRWGGDTNFMPVIAETKVLPELLAETAAKLRPYLGDDSGGGRATP